MDPDLNNYDVEHVCTAHPRMSKQEWEAIYHEAWSLYYTPQHMRDAAAPRGGDRRADRQPRKHAGDVFDHGSPRERPPAAGRTAAAEAPVRTPPRPAARNPWVFWPRFAWETLRKHADLALTIWRLARLRRAIARDPAAAAYIGPGADAGSR